MKRGAGGVEAGGLDAVVVAPRGQRVALAVGGEVAEERRPGGEPPRAGPPTSWTGSQAPPSRCVPVTTPARKPESHAATGTPPAVIAPYGLRAVLEPRRPSRSRPHALPAPPRSAAGHHAALLPERPAARRPRRSPRRDSPRRSPGRWSGTFATSLEAAHPPASPAARSLLSTLPEARARRVRALGPHRRVGGAGVGGDREAADVRPTRRRPPAHPPSARAHRAAADGRRRRGFRLRRRTRSVPRRRCRRSRRRSRCRWARPPRRRTHRRPAPW